MTVGHEKLPDNDNPQLITTTHKHGRIFEPVYFFYEVTTLQIKLNIVTSSWHISLVSSKLRPYFTLLYFTLFLTCFWPTLVKNTNVRCNFLHSLLQLLTPDSCSAGLIEPQVIIRDFKNLLVSFIWGCSVVFFFVFLMCWVTRWIFLLIYKEFPLNIDPWYGG